MVLVFYSLICLVIVRTSVGKMFFGGCPKIEPVADFDISKFYGVWYVIKRTAPMSKCNIMNIGLGMSESDISYAEKRLVRAPIVRSSVEINHAALGRVAEPGIFYVKFPWNLGSTRITVFDTDYTNYAGLYLCRSYLLFHKTTISFLARSLDFPKESFDKMATKVNTWRALSRLKFVNHTDCPPIDQLGPLPNLKRLKDDNNLVYQPFQLVFNYNRAKKVPTKVKIDGQAEGDSKTEDANEAEVLQQEETIKQEMTNHPEGDVGQVNSTPEGETKLTEVKTEDAEPTDLAVDEKPKQGSDPAGLIITTEDVKAAGNVVQDMIERVYYN